MLKMTTVITKAEKNATGTTSRYIESTSHMPPTISRILPASARAIAISDIPALGTPTRPETESQEPRVQDTRGQVDEPAQHRRQRPVPAGGRTGDPSDRYRGDDLPPEDGADGFGLEWGNQSGARDRQDVVRLRQNQTVEL